MGVKWKLKKKNLKNFLRALMPRQIITGLDVGTAATRVVVAEVIKQAHFPKIIALVRGQTRGVRRGYIINQEEATASINEAIREAEKTAKVKIKNVFLAVGGIGLESRAGDGQVAVSRADSEIGENDVNRAVELSEANLANFNNYRVIHTVPIGFKLDGKKVLGRPEGMKGNKLEVKTVFVACLNQHLHNLLRAVESARLTVEDIIASPLAASLSTLSNTQKAAGCVLVNIGSQTTAIAVFEEGLPITVQVLPIGSTDVTNDIALGLRVPPEEAERIKLGLDNSNLTTRKKLDEIIEARLSDMFELIESQLKKIGRNGLLPAGVILTGGGSHLADIDKLAKNYLHLPARVFSGDGDNSPRGQIHDSTWAVAYGLCLFGLGANSEESFGLKLIGQTKNKFIKWLKELLP